MPPWIAVVAFSLVPCLPAALPDGVETGKSPPPSPSGPAPRPSAESEPSLPVRAIPTRPLAPGGVRPGLGGAMMPRGGVSEFLALQERLGLSTSQVARLQAIEQKLSADIARAREAWIEKSAGLEEAVGAPATPEGDAAFEARLQEVASLQAGIQVLGFRARREGRKELTEAQWKAYREAVAARFAPIRPMKDPASGGPGSNAAAPVSPASPR